MIRPFARLLRALAAGALFGTCLLGQAAPARADGGPDGLLGQVGFDQRLNAQAPLDLPFRDESGAAVRLADYFGQRPVVLVLAYYRCPNVCSVSLHQLSDTLRELRFAAGREFSVVAVSIDPAEAPEDARAKKQEIVESYGRPAEAGGWHFLVGQQPAIVALARAVGFRYAYDATQRQFAHPIGCVVLTPSGTIARYFFGLSYRAGDMRLGLVEAAAGQIGTPIDQLLLRCFHYDPQVGRYSLAIMSVVRLASAAAVLGLAAAALLLWRRARPMQLKG